MWMENMCVCACVQILLMKFLVLYGLTALIAFHEVETRLLSENKMGDSIDEVHLL